jgi:hypothetical protein
MSTNPVNKRRSSASTSLARKGDWLLVTPLHGSPRRGQITTVHGADGGPPYTVHWMDTGHEAFVYPGPDAVVLTPDELAAKDAVAERHAQRVQREIASGSAHGR